jgi:hypothetical protein
MSTPENSSITEAELREADIIFHEIRPEELVQELEHGAKFVKFAVIRARWAYHLILTKNYVSPTVAIRDIPDCETIGWGEIHEVVWKDKNSLHSLEEAYRAKPISPVFMGIVRTRVLALI